MVIAGLERCSFVDWPGRIAAVVFTPGCNFDCYYCHNRALLEAHPDAPGLSPEAFLAWLPSRQGLLDGVVFSGGEPTLQPDLAEMIDAVRALGFMVKLDTNGARPHTLRALLSSGCLDFVAMDIKAPRGRYDEVCGRSVSQHDIDASIEAIMASGTAYEFRTTVLPIFDVEDIVSMATRIRGARRYVLQQYRPPERPPAAASTADLRAARRPHDGATLAAMAQAAAAYVTRCEVRGAPIENVLAENAI